MAAKAQVRNVCFALGIGMEILLKYKANPAMENLICELLIDVILANLVLELNMVLFKLVDILLVH